MKTNFFGNIDFAVNNIICKIYDIHDIECNQKYDGYNYSNHLKSVVNIMTKYAPDNLDNITFYIYKIAAAGHDTIEDARMTYNDIVKLIESNFKVYKIDYSNFDSFPIKVADIIYALTDEKGKNRAERHSPKYWEGIENTDGAAFIKCCDRLANIEHSIKTNSRMVDVYKKEYHEFLSHIMNSVDYKNRILHNVMDEIHKLSI